jgi:hypothetical protein
LFILDPVIPIKEKINNILAHDAGQAFDLIDRGFERPETPINCRRPAPSSAGSRDFPLTDAFMGDG